MARAPSVPVTFKQRCLPPSLPPRAQEPFELLARRAIGQLLPPALSCKERVHEELVRIAEQACPPEAGRWGWARPKGISGFTPAGPKACSLPTARP